MRYVTRMRGSGLPSNPSFEWYNRRMAQCSPPQPPQKPAGNKGLLYGVLAAVLVIALAAAAAYFGGFLGSTGKAKDEPPAQKDADKKTGDK